jgi:hypothetical protein
MMIGLVSLTLCQVICAATLPSDTKQTQHFMSIADIHFDPFTSCDVLATEACPIIKKLQQATPDTWDSVFSQYDSHKVSRFGHDTNYALLKSALNEIQQVNKNQNPTFTLILGDFLAHHFREKYISYSHDKTKQGYQKFVNKTLQFLAKQIRQAIPQGDIYPAVGNNDSYTGDYGVVPQGSFLHDTSIAWQHLISNNSNRQAFLREFPEGGYYAVTLPGNPKQKILVLDTVLFSTAVTGPHVKQAAQKELQWLHHQLERADKQHQRVLIACHVPTGIDVYATLRSFLGGAREFWFSEYTKEFGKNVQQFTHVIAAILPAHIHRDKQEWLDGSNPKMLMSFTPAISPIFGNNPGFKIYEYDKTSLKLQKYIIYYYSLNATHWEQSVFSISGS